MPRKDCWLPARVLATPTGPMPPGPAVSFRGSHAPPGSDGRRYREAANGRLGSPLGSPGHLTSASDVVEMSVLNADYGDKSRRFSWPSPATTSPSCPTTSPPAAVTATVLSHLGKHGPMLVVESDAVPEDVASYLEEIKPSYVAPNEALFNHAWSIGGEDTFSPGVQADIDELRNVNRRSTEFVTATFEGTVRLLYGCHEPGPRGGDGGYGGYRGLKVRCTTLGPGFEDCPEPGHLCSSSMRQSASPQGGGFFGSSSLARAGRRWRERRRTRRARATEVG
jgi:hypothetical protein